jgi:hypothetical protein
VQMSEHRGITRRSLKLSFGSWLSHYDSASKGCLILETEIRTSGSKFLPEGSLNRPRCPDDCIARAQISFTSALPLHCSFRSPAVSRARTVGASAPSGAGRPWILPETVPSLMGLQKPLLLETAQRRASSSDVLLGSRKLHGMGDGPHEAEQLTSDRRDGNLAFLAPSNQAPITPA